MERIASNENLHKGKSEKNNEFYSMLSNIVKEVRNYKMRFKNKVVLCNCDYPIVTNLFHFFSFIFELLGLTKLIATCCKNQDAGLFSQHESKRALQRSQL